MGRGTGMVGVVGSQGEGVVGVRRSRWSRDGRGSRGEGDLGVVRVRGCKGSRGGRGSGPIT